MHFVRRGSQVLNLDHFPGVDLGDPAAVERRLAEIGGRTFTLEGDDAGRWREVMAHFAGPEPDPEPEQPPQSWRDRPPML